MKALDRKVLRDLRLLWSQALTIALVVASGIGGFIATLSAVDSLAAARDDFYATGHFADVFATVKRAPDAMAARLTELPGVGDVQATVESFARVTVPGSVDPVMGQLIGLDRRHAQRLNRVQLASGRWPEAGSHAGGEIEAIANSGFADAHKLHLGATVSALVNGKRRTLRIVGTALSPEYIFGGVMGIPDLRAFGIFWLDQDELAAALDMRGAFNRVAIRLAPGAFGTGLGGAGRGATAEVRGETTGLAAALGTGLGGAGFGGAGLGCSALGCGTGLGGVGSSPIRSATEALPSGATCAALASSPTSSLRLTVTRSGGGIGGGARKALIASAAMIATCATPATISPTVSSRRNPMPLRAGVRTAVLIAGSLWRLD